MWSKYLMAACGVAILPILAGCATGNTDNMLYDIQRRVAELDKKVDNSTGKMSAAMESRLDSNEQQLKALETASNDNAAKLGNIEAKLEKVSNSLNRGMGLSSRTQLPVGSDVVPIAPTRPLGDTEPPAMGATSTPGIVPLTPPPAVSTAPPAPPEPGPLATIAPAAPPATPAAPPATTPSTESAEALYQVAQKTYVGQNYAKALDEFSRYLEQYPNTDSSANAQFWKAKCLLSLEKYGDAVPEFEKVKANFPNHQKAPLAMHQEAVCYARLGQTQKAVDLLNQVIRDYPSTPAADQARTDLKRLQQR
jgi:tol-pal system protein YbgF